MNKTFRELFRWVVVLVCSGFGIDALVLCIGAISSGRPLFLICFLLAMSSLLLCIACLSLRRQYEPLVTIFAGITAVIVWGALVSLPQHLGLFESFTRGIGSFPLALFIGFPLSLLCLFGPFYAARWSFQFFEKLCLNWMKQRPSQTTPP